MPTIIFFGDSITEGKIGSSYVERLRRALGDAAHVVNAGVNGDTVLNLRRRVLRDVVPHTPDIVVVMTGLNDLASVYALRLQRAYYRVGKGVNRRVTLQVFGAEYRNLVADLRRHTSARIVLATPTALTEMLNAPVQHAVEAYANVVRALALQEGVALIDVRKPFLASIAADPREGEPYRLETAVRDMWTVRRGVTYAELAERRRYRLLCDGAHLADAGADLVAAVMLDPLRDLLAGPDQPRHAPTSHLTDSRLAEQP